MLNTHCCILVYTNPGQSVSLKYDTTQRNKPIFHNLYKFCWSVPLKEKCVSAKLYKQIMHIKMLQVVDYNKDNSRNTKIKDVFDPYIALPFKSTSVLCIQLIVKQNYRPQDEMLFIENHITKLANLLILAYYFFIIREIRK